MEKNSMIDRASSVILMGLTCCTIVSANTSTGIRTLTTDDTGIYSTANEYGTTSTVLKDYKIFKGKMKVEKEAEEVFGDMREATVDEQRNIQKHIEKISVSTGVNFWG